MSLESEALWNYFRAPQGSKAEKVAAKDFDRLVASSPKQTRSRATPSARKADPAKVRKWKQTWVNKNKASFYAMQRAWVVKNKERVAKWKKEWAANNPDKVAAAQQRWLATKNLQ